MCVVHYSATGKTENHTPTQATFTMYACNNTKDSELDFYQFGALFMHKTNEAIRQDADEMNKFSLIPPTQQHQAFMCLSVKILINKFLSDGFSVSKMFFFCQKKFILLGSI